jgi:TRAP transporter TAXI family solute receptor
MKKAFVIGSLFFLMAAIMFGCGGDKEGETKSTGATFVTIGTGGITGVYYPTGGAIAKMVNAKRKDYGIRATVESTGGSVFNINAILAGDLEFGVAQSDRQYQAVKGLADWKDKGPQEDLRAVFSIHAENVDLIAAVDSNINSIQDLKGKRVNIGNVGSGYRQNAIDALEANGLDFENDFHSESLKAAEAPGLIQDGRIDAAFYTVGHPSGYYKEATAGARKVKFIEIPNADKLVAKYPYYAASKTLISNYPGADNSADVPTFGVKATFVTSAKVADDVVYAITKEVFDNFDTFKKLHPAYAGLTKEDMLKGISAPFHPGAIKYFKEAGLM